MAIWLNPTNTSVKFYGENNLMCISEEFSNHAPRETYLLQSQYEALREYFQAERDEELGRWRDPENPDMVCYPDVGDLDVVRVMYEGDGSRYYVTRIGWELTRPHYASETAERYFAAHPPKKPWDAAQPDEVWALTINNDREEVFRCGENGLYSLKTGNPLGSLLSCSHNKITAGRRIWPEGGDK